MKYSIIALFAAIDNRKFLLWGIVVLVAVLITVMAIPPDTPIFIYISGQKNKLELIKFVGWGITGLIAIFGVIGLLQRATALDQQNEMMEKGHIQERFNAATTHLGNDRVSVRIAAFYDFCRLATIESEPDLRKHIFDILCAHLRQTTKHKDYALEFLDNKETTEIKPTEEVQSLLNILFKDNFLFDGLVANLEETNLQGADLQNANLRKANLRKANLQKAHLRKANLQKADITDANLQEAKMWLVDLQKANLQKANLHKTEILYADLRGAHLCLKIPEMKFSPEESRNANLQKAILFGSKINQDTIMPNDWKNVVGTYNYKIGVEFVDD